MTKILPTTLVTTLVVFGMFISTNIALGATYLYINTSGNSQTIEANSPTEAMALATNRTLHSGVMLITSTSIPITTTPTTPIPTGTGSQAYLFVDVNGNLQTVNANSSTEAMAIAPNKALHSGVMLAN